MATKLISTDELRNRLNMWPSQVMVQGQYFPNPTTPQDIQVIVRPVLDLIDDLDRRLRALETAAP